MSWIVDAASLAIATAVGLQPAMRRASAVVALSSSARERRAHQPDVEASRALMFSADSTNGKRAWSRLP